MLRQTLVVLAVTSVALAAIIRLPLEEKPEEYKDREGCWVSEIRTFIPIGRSAPTPMQCGQYRCTATELLIVPCDEVGTASKTFHVGDTIFFDFLV